VNFKILSVILVLALAGLACGFSINLPEPPTPGPDVTEEVKVAVPAGAGNTRLQFEFGAGDLKLAPGAGADLVSGTATYNMPDLKPAVTVQDGEVLIRQGERRFRALPDFSDMKNVWDLRLGDAPMDLTITAGAYNAEYELGGLALTSLTVKDGASDVALSFSSPNRSEMSLLRYETGASSVELEGLANANFNTLVFQSGAGDYKLDFSGELKRSATITISSGLSNIVIRVPTNVNASLTLEGGLTNVVIGSHWNKNGNLYTQTGSGPTLTFVVEMGAGNLSLKD